MTALQAAGVRGFHPHAPRQRQRDTALAEGCSLQWEGPPPPHLRRPRPRQPAAFRTGTVVCTNVAGTSSASAAAALECAPMSHAFVHPNVALPRQRGRYFGIHIGAVGGRSGGGSFLLAATACINACGAPLLACAFRRFLDRPHSTRYTNPHTVSSPTADAGVSTCLPVRGCSGLCAFRSLRTTAWYLRVSLMSTPGMADVAMGPSDVSAAAPLGAGVSLAGESARARARRCGRVPAMLQFIANGALSSVFWNARARVCGVHAGITPAPWFAPPLRGRWYGCTGRVPAFDWSP